MKNLILRGWLAALLGSFVILVRARAADGGSQLQVVAEFPHQQVTGVGVSKSGRIFVNFPYWSEGHTVSVEEVIPGGENKPYPNADWNRPTLPAEKRFVCVQSVVVDDNDVLWVVDAGSPLQTGVIPGGAKLVKIDLAKNAVAQTFVFNDQVAPKKSYLNDVRVDTKNGFAVMTESKAGSLIVVNLATGNPRVVLANDPSTKADPKLKMVVEGVTLIDPDTEKPFVSQADSLALDAQGGWVYYKPLTSRQLYRVRLADLENESMSDAALGKSVEKVTTIFPTDGMEFRNGEVYLTSAEKDAVLKYNVASKKLETVVSDSRLKWPDSLAWGPDGSLYVTTSQIHLTPRFHGGENKVVDPYRLFKITSP